MKRLHSLLAAVVATSSLSIVACSSSNAAPSSGGPASTGAGTCDSACAYYLGCKGTDTTDTRQQCNANCAQQGYTSDQLAGFQKLECAAAVCTIERNCGGSSSGSTSGGSSSGGKDCYGCQSDGTSCIYIAPGGGAYSQCDPSCC